MELATIRVEVGHQLARWWRYLPNQDHASTAVARLGQEWAGHRPGWHKGMSFLNIAWTVAEPVDWSWHPDLSPEDVVRNGAEGLRVLDADPRSGVALWVTPDRWRSPGPRPAIARPVRVHALLAQIDGTR